MMRLIVLVILLLNNVVISQNKNLDSLTLNLKEKFEVKNFIAPNNVLFFAAGNSKSEYFFDLIFKHIRDEVDVDENKLAFFFEEVHFLSRKGMFYEGNDINNTYKNYPYICYLELGKVNEKQRGFCQNKKCKFSFYMTLVDVKNEIILLKRKYIVNTKKYYYTECETIANEIIKELQFKL